MNDGGKLTRVMDNLLLQIDNASIREFTCEMICRLPSSWERPASRRHHLLDEREEYGNLLHTIRVASLCRMITSMVDVRFEFDYPRLFLSPEIKADILLSASILHDMCRHGLDGESAESAESVDNHPQLVREFANKHNLSCDCFDTIMLVIESHMGKWTVPEPIHLSIDICTALHLADSIIARWAEIIPDGQGEME